MIITRILVVCISIIVLIAPGQAKALKPLPLDLSTAYGNGQWDYYLEKNNGSPAVDAKVVNPLTQSCTWDINDHFDYSGPYGYLNPNATTSKTICQVENVEPQYVCYSAYCAWWSGSESWFGGKVFAPSGNLNVNVCYDPPGRCFTFPPTQVDSNDWTYEFCVQAVYDEPPYDTTGLVQVVPGSTPDPYSFDGNGYLMDGVSAPGFGVVTNITMTISNPTNRQIKGIAPYFGVSSDIFFPQGCGSGFTGGVDPNDSNVTKQSDFPFRWVTQWPQ